jgi:hypothetical protein
VQTYHRIERNEFINQQAKESQLARGYWAGACAGRPDPGIRAAYFRFIASEDQVKLRLFSYDELIAVAWLLARRIDAHRAAALVSEEYVIAAPYGARVKAPFPHYDFVKVMLFDGSEWAVGSADASTSNLAFVEDYAVWDSETGEMIDVTSDHFKPRWGVESFRLHNPQQGCWPIMLELNQLRLDAFNAQNIHIDVQKGRYLRRWKYKMQFNGDVPRRSLNRFATEIGADTEWTSDGYPTIYFDDLMIHKMARSLVEDTRLREVMTEEEVLEVDAEWKRRAQYRVLFKPGNRPCPEELSAKIQDTAAEVITRHRWSWRDDDGTEHVHKEVVAVLTDSGETMALLRLAYRGACAEHHWALKQVAADALESAADAAFGFAQIAGILLGVSIRFEAFWRTTFLS